MIYGCTFSVLLQNMLYLCMPLRFYDLVRVCRLLIVVLYVAESSVLWCIWCNYYTDECFYFRNQFHISLFQLFHHIYSFVKLKCQYLNDMMSFLFHFNIYLTIITIIGISADIICLNPFYVALPRLRLRNWQRFLIIFTNLFLFVIL